MDEPTRRARWGRVDFDSLLAIAPNMSAVAVYAYLCVHANRRGEAWPQPARIAADLGVSSLTVRRALRLLAELEVIESERVEGRFRCVVTALA